MTFSEESNWNVNSVGELIDCGALHLIEAGVCFGHGTDNAYDESVLLSLHALGLPSEVNISVLKDPVSASQQQAVRALIERRIHERIPAAYLTGSAWFADLEFFSDKRALVPRSPIAELVERGFEPWIDSHHIHHVLDLCCGGGCIGIAAACYLPSTQVSLSDLSEPALDLAKSNIHRHQLESRVMAYRSDLFKDLPANGRYDVIVSNPPYVDHSDFSSMPDEYSHEPSLGLQAGQDGLDLVRRILSDAAGFLNNDGILIVEVGNSQQALEQAYPRVPFTWLAFERGGHGVFLLRKAELVEHFSV